MSLLNQIVDWAHRRLYGKDEPVNLDQEVREAFHRNANEQMKLRHSFREIAEAADPLEELARRIRREQHQ